MRSFLPKRRLIPKWRPVAVTLEAAEATSPGKKVNKNGFASESEFDLAVANWRETKAPGLLGEVLSFSVHDIFLEKVIAVGNEALKDGAPVTSVQSMLIRDLGGNPGQIGAYRAVLPISAENVQPFQAPISRLRALLRNAPDNALALLDYAQLQTAIGKVHSAERALRTALTLAPNNRTVLRTVARFYVHSQRADTAHQLILRHPRTAEDPWLMASEIALADAAQSNSVFLGKARRFLLDNSKFPSSHLTELAGSIAVAELKSGNIKRARENQRIALLAPNDNVIAQAVNLRQLFGIELSTPSVTRAIALSSEALVLQAWEKVAPDEIEKYAQEWHAEEPFSSRPIQMLSSIYVYQGNHSKALRWIKAGLLTDPSDNGLLVNLAFVQAHMGEEVTARTTIRRMRNLHGKIVEPYARATEGLLAYREKQFNLGDILYNSAFDEFCVQDNRHTAAFCKLHQAFIALEHNHPESQTIVQDALKQIQEFPGLDSKLLLKIKFPDEFSKTTEKNTPERLMSQWVFDTQNNSLVEKVGLTSVGAKRIIFSEKSKKNN